VETRRAQREKGFADVAANPGRMPRMAEAGFALELSLIWHAIAIRFCHLSNKFPDFDEWYSGAGRRAVAPPQLCLRTRRAFSEY
jgi:hypothetical protein